MESRKKVILEKKDRLNLPNSWWKRSLTRRGLYKIKL
jgi:hypothetical protein